MTKLINFGWQADRLCGNSVQQVFVTPSIPINITGYSLKLATRPSSLGVFSTPGGISDILFFIRIDAIENNDDWGAPVYTDNSGGHQNLHGGGLAGSTLVTSILNASPWTVCVNDLLTASGLELFVPERSPILVFAAHAGKGPVNFEVQGIIAYENAGRSPATR